MGQKIRQQTHSTMELAIRELATIGQKRHPTLKRQISISIASKA
jgi:hypothetical protein